MKTPKLNIIQDAEHPVERNVLAKSIVDISNAVKQLRRGGLNFNAVVVLTHHNCKPAHRSGQKPGIADVRKVLESLGELEERYCSKK